MYLEILYGTGDAFRTHGYRKLTIVTDVNINRGILTVDFGVLGVKRLMADLAPMVKLISENDSTRGHDTNSLTDTA